MKRRSAVKRGCLLAVASALLVSPLFLLDAQAQNRPPRDPKIPVEIETPKFRKPIPRGVPFLLDPPTIEAPTSKSGGVDLEKPMVVSGTGMDGSHLHIIVKGEWEVSLRNRKPQKMKRTLSDSITYADSRGNWKTKPIQLNIPKQAKKIKFEISAVQTVAGKKSDPTVITVGPKIIMMTLDLPMAQATIAPMLHVTTPKDGSKIPAKDKRLFLEGTAIGGKAVNVQMTMEVHMTNGNWFTGGEKKTKRQIHRRVDDVPVKNGKWSTYIDITPQKGDKGITKTTFEIFVSLQGQSVDRRILLTQ